MDEIKLEEMVFSKTTMFAGIECETPCRHHRMQRRIQRAHPMVICVE